MKHLFIINPYAGPADTTRIIKSKVQAFEEWVDIDWTTYVTTGPLDATRKVNEVCKKFIDVPLRIYACGGDGTLNEVVTGVMGFHNVQVTCFPSGSGNDFLRCYGSKSDFRDIDRLIEGESRKVDVMRVTVGRGPKAQIRYGVNIFTLGFTASSVNTMINVKRIPLIGGTNAFTTGIISSIFGGMKSQHRITIDGELFNNQPLIICDICNGKYLGGGHKCAPDADNNDGLLDVYKYKAVHLLRFLRLYKYYKAGTHVDHPQFSDVIKYQRGKDIVIESDHPFPAAIDGEMLMSDYYHIELLHDALSFVTPKGL